MTHHDILNPRHNDMVAHHPTNAQATSEGERDYVEHLNAQKLSLGERLLVVGALVLLGVAGLTGHLNSSVSPEVTGAIAAPATFASSHGSLDSCREYNPFAEKRC
ncbi:hypothetical protein IE4872_PD00916 (plasmid) [Rhizobium gallicum]|uniref:Uncharacterized protein n=1 Tax=Rhizobium gallicum TaxID=56730 RepID=A0A1L5NU70_9HYPH|nr:hypothetical protein [Rhizobium gallicum]APO71445.1 hypothetical protein IE4872_PD00916 [Rhizobium gallicum]